MEYLLIVSNIGNQNKISVSPPTSFHSLFSDFEGLYMSYCAMQKAEVYFLAYTVFFRAYKKKIAYI